MSKFKIGDWVLYHHPEDEGMQLAEIKTNEQLSQADDDDSIELWQPKEGEFIIPENFSKSSTDSFEVIKWKEGYTFKCEPFIGTLPSFLQGK